MAHLYILVPKSPAQPPLLLFGQSQLFNSNCGTVNPLLNPHGSCLFQTHLLGGGGGGEGVGLNIDRGLF